MWMDWKAMNHATPRLAIRIRGRILWMRGFPNSEVSMIVSYPKPSKWADYLRSIIRACQLCEFTTSIRKWTKCR